MSINPEQDNNSIRTEEFLRLLMEHQYKIRAYIAVLVPNYADADDIMQETIATMWRKYEEFEPGTNFGAWGSRIAYLNTKYYYRKKSKYTIWSDEKLFEQFVDSAMEQYDNQEDRLTALRECSKKLEANDKKLLKMRYESNRTISDIARSSEKSDKYFYRQFGRIHNLIYRCVRRTLVEWGVL